MLSEETIPSPPPRSFSCETVKFDEQEYSRLSEVVRSHCGINLHGGKKDLVRARLAAPIRAGGFGGVGEYLRNVLADPSGRRLAQMIGCLSTNLTSFFREGNHFEFLSNRFLPRLMEQKSKSGNRRIRVWSAGCSSGEEPYSLAMTLLRALGPERDRWNVKILATDISTRSLDAAIAGLYPRESLGNVPPAYRAIGFSSCRAAGDTPLAVSPAVRELVAFRRLNLIADWPFNGALDLIFCRNVMIYFDRPTQERLVHRFRRQLLPGGLLFIGHAESLTGVDHDFHYVEPTIYSK
jgi:chemotaxis protein methyltransferase CheR